MNMNNSIDMLLIEDNPGDSEYLQELLAGEREPGFSIVPVQRLTEAIALLRDRSYDIILLDLGLPDSQGMDTLTAITGRSAAPIIILTGLADEDFALRAIKAGAADYLIKGQINRILIVRTIRYAIERKRADEVLRESGQRLQLAIQAGRMAAWSWNAETQRMAVSDNFPEIYGRPPITNAEEAYALVHPEDRERHRAEVQAALATGESYRSEFRVIRPDTSEVMWVEERARLYRDPSGGVTRISGIAMDVTERKRTEERIAHLASFPESNPTPIIEIDLDGRITYTNPAMRERFPGILEQGLGHPLLANWKTLTEGMKQADAPTYGREVAIEAAFFHQFFYYSPNRTYFRIHNYDITERKLAEQALRESEERYRITMETALDAIFTIDEESRILVVNPAVERIFGYRPDQLTGRSLVMLMPERFREAHRKAVAKVVATGRRHLPWGAVELPGLHKDGKEIPLEISYGEYHKDGKHFFIGVVRDISERKRVEESLRRRDAVLKQAGQMANVGAWEVEFVDPENVNAGRLTWSDQVYRIFGYEPRTVEVTKPFFYEHVHPEDRSKVIEAFERALSRDRSYSIEHRIVRPDGTERIVWERAEISFDSQGKPRRIVGAVQDITDRKRAEEAIAYRTYRPADRPTEPRPAVDQAGARRNGVGPDPEKNGRTAYRP